MHPENGGGAVHASHNNLGVLNGCYIPCLLNILGAVLFSRVGFSVGFLGWVGALEVFCFSETIAYLTITSFSALVTNGHMRGGGAYYMISRSLGPAFGGSSGLLFWLTYCLNVTFNTVAFTEMFVTTFLPEWSGGNEGQTDCSVDADADNNMFTVSPERFKKIGVSSVTLFILFLVGFKGAGAFAKVNMFIFIGLMISLGAGIGTIWLSHTPAAIETDLVHLVNLSGAYGSMQSELLPARWADAQSGNLSAAFFPFAWSAECPKASLDGVALSCGPNGRYGLKETAWAPSSPIMSSQCGCAPCDLAGVFGIVFPAVVGMMEGANLSGDLANPGYAIPYGTLAAVSTAFFFYVMLILGQAGSLDRVALQFDMDVMQDACINQYFIALGITTACLSTALGSLFGSARILQALARDNIYPILRPFAFGSRLGDEPRVAIVICWAIAQAGLLLGDLSAVAPILTNFFLITYTLTNLAAFFLAISKVPNYRPHFRFTHPIASLLGASLTLAAMIYLNALFALVTVLVVLALFVYIQLCFKERAKWVDISYALAYKAALAALRVMKHQRRDPKYWRPCLTLLLPAEMSAEATPLVGCFASMAAGAPVTAGRAVVASPSMSPPRAPPPAAADPRGSGVLPGNGGVAIRLLDAQQALAAQVHAIGAALPLGAADVYPQLVVGATLPLAIHNLVLGAGLGALSPDTLVVPLPPLPTEPNVLTSAGGDGGVDDADTITIVNDALAMRRNCLVATNFGTPRAAECWGARSNGLQLMARQAAEALSGSAVTPVGAATIDVWLIGALPLASADAHDRVLRRLGLAAQFAYLASQAAAARHKQLRARAGRASADAPKLTRKARMVGAGAPRVRLLQLVRGIGESAVGGGATVPLNSSLSNGAPTGGGDGGSSTRRPGEWVAMTSDAPTLVSWLKAVRIDAEVVTVPMPHAASAGYDDAEGGIAAKWLHAGLSSNGVPPTADGQAALEALSLALRHESRQASLVLVPLPLGAVPSPSAPASTGPAAVEGSGDAGRAAPAWGLLRQLSTGMPPTIFAFEGSGAPVTTTEI